MRTKINRSAVLFVTVILWLSWTPSVRGEDTFQPYASRVTGERVNLRLGPGTDYPVVTQGENDYPILVIGRSEGWLRMRWPDHVGLWIHAEFVSDIKDGFGTVTGNNVNARLGPSTSYPILKQFMIGDTIEIIAQDLEWFAIRAPEGLSCWIIQRYTQGHEPADAYYEHIHMYHAQGIYDSLNTQYEKYLMGDASIDLAALKKGLEDIATFYPQTRWGDLGQQKARDVEYRLQQNLGHDK